MANFADKHSGKDKKPVVDESENDFPLKDIFSMRIGSGYIHPSRSYETVELEIFKKYVRMINEYYDPESSDQNEVVFEEIED